MPFIFYSGSHGSEYLEFSNEFIAEWHHKCIEAGIIDISKIKLHGSVNSLDAREPYNEIAVQVFMDFKSRGINCAKPRTMKLWNDREIDTSSKIQMFDIPDIYYDAGAFTIKEYDGLENVELSQNKLKAHEFNRLLKLVRGISDGEFRREFEKSVNLISNHELEYYENKDLSIKGYKLINKKELCE